MSKARDNGVSITDILKRGCWKSQNAFTNFYSKDKIVGKTWIIPSFSLKYRKSINSIYLFIYFYAHRLIRNIYKFGVVNLNSGHKSIKCRVYI